MKLFFQMEGSSLKMLAGKLTPPRSQVNSSDYPGVYDEISCTTILQPLSLVVGYTGGSIAYLYGETCANPTYNVSDVSVSSTPTSQGGENVTFRMDVGSFSRPFTLGLSLAESSVRVFNSNPMLRTLPANDSCSWYANDINGMSITAFQDMPDGYLQVKAPTVQMNEYSNATYDFSVLILGPIASNTAMDTTLAIAVPGGSQSYQAVAAYFPIRVAGALQTVSGSCLGVTAE